MLYLTKLYDEVLHSKRCKLKLHCSQLLIISRKVKAREREEVKTWSRNEKGCLRGTYIFSEVES
jgi:hypothetical protein